MVGFIYAVAYTWILHHLLREMMSMEYAVLGFLNYAPLTGYDLKKAFDASVRHFWSADQSQIYRTLARLAERGWVEVEVIQQETRPPRKVYHITDAGREALRRWLREPIPLEETHLPWLVQLFFAGQLSDEEVIALLERRAALVRASLERLKELPKEGARYAEAVGSPREAFFWWLTLESASPSPKRPSAGSRPLSNA